MKLPDRIINWVAQKAKQEYEMSFSFVQTKRDFFRNNYRLIMNQWGDNKIYERLMFRMVDMMCALSHKFRPSVTFMARSEDDKEYIKMQELVKEFDYDEMWMWMKNYWMHRYKYVFGVGIQVRDTFNKFTSTPQYKIMNPMSWIPDVAYDVNGGFRYHWFEVETTIEELKYNKDFYNVEFLKDEKTLQAERSSEQQQNYQARISNRRLQEVTAIPEWVYSVYQHFTIFEGNKYEIRLGNERTTPIFCRWIKPILQEEKDDPSKVWFGVNIRHYRPLPWDPYWVSFAFDLLLDKQKQIQTFHNLNLIKAKESALWAKYLYDPEIVTAENMNVLQKAFETTIYVPVPWMSKMNVDAVRELPKANITQQAFEFPNVLDNIVVQDTGMDERTMWVSAWPQITRAESERVQINANIRLLLWANFDIEAEKEFYRTLRYREYVENKRYVKNKFVELTNGVQVIPMYLEAKDFLTTQDPRMKAVSTIDAQEQKEKKRLSFMAVFNTLFQWASSQFGKTKLMKIMADLHDVDKEITDVVFWKSQAEMQAMEDLVLIGKWIVPKIWGLDEDHDTFIDIYNSSPNTETKLKAIFNRQLAKAAQQEMMKMAQQQPQQVAPVSPWMENQALAQASNRATPNATSLAQVA